MLQKFMTFLLIVGFILLLLPFKVVGIIILIGIIVFVLPVFFLIFKTFQTLKKQAKYAQPGYSQNPNQRFKTEDFEQNHPSQPKAKQNYDIDVNCKVISEEER